MRQRLRACCWRLWRGYWGFERLLQSEDVRALAGQDLAESLKGQGLEKEKLAV